MTGLRDVTKRQCKNLTRFAASRHLTANIEAESPIYDTLRRDFSVRPLASIIQNGASNYRGYHRSHAKIFVRELHFLGVVQVMRLLPPHPHPPPPFVHTLNSECRDMRFPAIWTRTQLFTIWDRKHGIKFKNCNKNYKIRGKQWSSVINQTHKIKQKQFY